jgi:hypothetical protein
MCLKRFWIPLATSLLIATRATTPAVEVLTPAGSLPPGLVGQMREPAAFVETTDGRFVIFDRRAQQIYSVDAAKTRLTRLVDIGASDGEILRPAAFAYNANRTFTVIDQPGDYERVQTFYDDGTPLSRFQRWPVQSGATRVSVGAATFRGLGAVAPLGRNVLTSGIEPGALMSEVDSDGHVVRHIGQPRPTGHETDPLLHQALNAGLPVVSTDGSIYFVFVTGTPMFRKYSSHGDLMFERHIEGPELDATLQALPTSWPTRRIGTLEFPAVASTVTTAAIDPKGALWISLAEPFTYVYDEGGNKTRTVQFRGSGLMTPTSFFFAPGGRLLVTPGCYEFSAY